MDEYYGIIDEMSVQNIIDPEKQLIGDGVEFLGMGIGNVRFIHYPDCQQLSIRIPNNGWDYKSFRLYDVSNGDIVTDMPMINVLNGNYQILYDTVALKPGAYTMELNWKFDFKHLISFVKHEVKEIAKVQAQPAAEPVATYNNADRNRRVIYEGNVRSATIIYIDGPLTLRFSSEMGGGNCFFYIMVPTEAQWERYTKTPLKERDDILQFVAEAMQREQASGKRFEIDDTQITYYHQGF